MRHYRNNFQHFLFNATNDGEPLPNIENTMPPYNSHRQAPAYAQAERNLLTEHIKEAQRRPFNPHDNLVAQEVNRNKPPPCERTYRRHQSHIHTDVPYNKDIRA
jgi:hypothetical protein